MYGALELLRTLAPSPQLPAVMANLATALIAVGDMYRSAVVLREQTVQRADARADLRDATRELPVRLATLYRQFQPLVVATPAFADPPRERTAVWLAPKLVAQIAFHEWTADRKLRQPVFLGLRDDKSPRECRLPERV